MNDGLFSLNDILSGFWSLRNDWESSFCLLCFTFAFFNVSYDQVFSYVSCFYLLDSSKSYI